MIDSFYLIGFECAYILEQYFKIHEHVQISIFKIIISPHTKLYQTSIIISNLMPASLILTGSRVPSPIMIRCINRSMTLH